MGASPLAAYVTAQLAALCPIDGVSFGSLTDPTTWVIAFDPSATPTQQAAAQAWISGFNVAAWQAQQQQALAAAPVAAVITGSYNSSLQRQAAKLAAKGKTAQATALYLKAAGVLS